MLSGGIEASFYCSSGLLGTTKTRQKMKNSSSTSINLKVSYASSEIYICDWFMPNIMLLQYTKSVFFSSYLTYQGLHDPYTYVELLRLFFSFFLLILMFHRD